MPTISTRDTRSGSLHFLPYTRSGKEAGIGNRVLNAAVTPSNGKSDERAQISQGMNSEFDYDAATDSLYIKLRPGKSVDNRIVGDDIVVDIGIDGEPVGYDIQHASQHPEAIAEALGYLHQRHAA